MSNNIGHADDATLQSAASANGNGTAMPVGGVAGVGLQVTGTFGGTVNWEGTIDGSNWVALLATNVVTGVAASTTTGTGVFYLPVAGLDQIRARISGYASGSVTVVGKAVAVPSPMVLLSLQASSTIGKVAQGAAASASDRWPVGISNGTLELGIFAEDAAHSSAHVGLMPLAVRNDADADRSGTDGDYTPFATDGAGRQKVNAAEERVVMDVTPTCDTSAYTAGDVLFDRTSCGNVARVVGGVVELESVTILDEDDQTAAGMTLFFLDSDVTLGTANSAPSVSDANARKILGWVPIASGDWVDVGGAKVATVRNIGLTLKADAASQVIYVAAVCAGTPTQTASGIKLKLAFKRAA